MDILYYIASPVAVLVSTGVGFYLGRTGQRRSELEVRIRDLEALIWQFARVSEEYWSLDPQDDKLLNFQITMKHLSTRIGSDIKHLNSRYGDFHFDNHSYLLALRQAATSSPFEEKGRHIDPQRGDDIRRAACELVHQISMARRNFWRRLIRGHFSIF